MANMRLDSPPSVPLFSGVTPNKAAKHDSVSEALTTAATAVVSVERNS